MRVFVRWRRHSGSVNKRLINQNRPMFRVSSSSASRPMCVYRAPRSLKQATGGWTTMVRSSHRLCRKPSSLSTEYCGSFPGGLTWRSGKLTTHLHLIPRLKSVIYTIAAPQVISSATQQSCCCIRHIGFSCTVTLNACATVRQSLPTVPQY
jgi:hypothetical protein